MNSVPVHFTSADIVAARGPKNRVDPQRPHAFFVERERSAAGRVDDVATIFLTNRECPFRCLMCDLWKNTLDGPVPPGAVPAQIDYALSRLPETRHVKLYNSGNFFDAQAIPQSDHPAIADRVASFETVIVENHPKLCSEVCVEFRDRIQTRLEIAIGLETVHPQILPALNKQMTLDDFRRAVVFLHAHEIGTRAFILLRPPFLSESEAVEWAVRSIEYAFSLAVGCCSVIPTRAGNPVMDELQRRGHFAPPGLSAMEDVLDAGLKLKQGRVFLDLWDLPERGGCQRCGPARLERLRRMNLAQTVLPRITCEWCPKK